VHVINSGSIIDPFKENEELKKCACILQLVIFGNEVLGLILIAWSDAGILDVQDFHFFLEKSYD
jgi:hypothetical protein